MDQAVKNQVVRVLSRIHREVYTNLKYASITEASSSSFYIFGDVFDELGGVFLAEENVEFFSLDRTNMLLVSITGALKLEVDSFLYWFLGSPIQRILFMHEYVHFFHTYKSTSPEFVDPASWDSSVATVVSAAKLDGVVGRFAKKQGLIVPSVQLLTGRR